MVRKLTLILSWFLALFLVLGTFTCCSDEYELNQKSGETESLVKFSVQVPSKAPKTYALNQADENEIKSVTILLFDKEGYTEAVHCTNIINDPSAPANSVLKTFSAKLPIGTYDMVLLANLEQQLLATVSNIPVGETKTLALKRMELLNTAKWNTDSSSGSYLHIPMWSEIPNITVNNDIGTINATLLRMLAKIDVLITEDAKSNFSLESVHLYNYYDRGRVTPDAENWDNTLKKVFAQTLTTFTTPKKLGNPNATPPTPALLYDGQAITKDVLTGTRGESCQNEIYMFEAVEGSTADFLNNTCLVIGGIYGDDNQVTYYRADIANTNEAAGTTTYLPILRNHNYKLNIESVSASGFTTPDEAFNALPINIKANVLNWNDTQITDIVFDGQYLLGVSQGEFTFSREKRDVTSKDNTLFVTTDFPTGWEVEKIVDAATGSNVAWLSVDVTKGASNSTTKTKLILSPNEGGSIRSANIHLKAGRLTYILKVHQLTTIDMGITINNTTGQEIKKLAFVAAKDVMPDMQQFQINWSPPSSSLFYTSTSTSNSFEFNTGPGLDDMQGSGSLNDASGSKLYTIQPPAITTADLESDPFYERSSVYLYSVSDGVNTATNTLILSQFVYNMVPDIDAIYLMDGGQKSFSVRSNSPFTVSIKSNSKNVVSGLSTSGLPNIGEDGTPVYFDVIDDLTDPTIFKEDVVVTITSPDGHFADTDVTLTCASGIIQPESNSYIVAPGGAGILIPVSRVNTAAVVGTLGETEPFIADLVWTDNENRIASNSNIAMIREVGVGSDGYILVLPGSAEGNAVVSVKNLAAVIHWSWHIWVTDYTPTPSSTGGFMDRNLGAIGNTPGEVATTGLLYQWGRKDPFPGPSIINVNGQEPLIYNSQGPVSIAKIEVRVTNNLSNATSNPATFYTSQGSQSINGVRYYDWYTDTTKGNNTLWSPTVKTVYDPCPSGWHVPQVGAWDSKLTSNNFPWNAISHGRTNVDYGGFYPAVGYRYPATGTLSSVGWDGRYWSTNEFTNGHMSTLDVASTTTLKEGYSRAGGGSVRCVKD